MVAPDQSKRSKRSPLSREVQNEILSLIPNLRTFAISLCGNPDRADDLVQETLLRALTHIESFEPGTNLAGWLATILRNCFLSEVRKRRKEVEDAEGCYAARLRSAPEQESRIEFEEFRVAFAKLPFDQREALLLVGAAGLSYEDIAAIYQTKIGTIKSRINRARSCLATLLSINGAVELGCDDRTRAILAGNQSISST